MIIVIPMAGLSSRFINVGMAPKYVEKVGPFQTMFDFALKSFEKWFKSAKFLITCKDDFAMEYAKSHCENLGIEDFEILNLGATTKGQAETVYLTLCEYHLEDSAEELMIFNIDSQRRNIEIPDDDIWDTLFDAFYDENADNSWSFAKVDKDDNVLETAEKRKISSWCSTGLYIFRSASLFADSYREACEGDEYNYYIAPLYNYLKGMNNRLLRCDMSDIDILGTPKQYTEYIDKHFNTDKNSSQE